VSEKDPSAFEKAKGFIKAAVGKAKGDEDMKAEGRAEREGDSEEKEITSIVRKSVERSRGEAS
jgi:uncharacterized protein YjbJ (UPF0337 family)